MDNNKIVVFIKEYESEGKLERVADVKATLKYAERLLSSMEEEEIETPEGYTIFSHLIAACEEMERYLTEGDARTKIDLEKEQLRIDSEELYNF